MTCFVNSGQKSTGGILTETLLQCNSPHFFTPIASFVAEFFHVIQRLEKISVAVIGNQ